MNRSYEKPSPFRDARTFVIIAEGEREEKYFSFFNEKNRRIIVKICKIENGKSAPKHLIDRLEKFRKSGEWMPEINDSVWFVFDIDKWKRTSINSIISYCKSFRYCNVAISNPCFEVWLHYHAGDIKNKNQKCSDLKKELPKRIKGGFNSKNICVLIENAMINAKKADPKQKSHLPDVMQTKVYKLAEEMLEVLGRNWK